MNGGSPDGLPRPDSPPDMAIPAGIYTVIDSDPMTWSQNEETEGSGISRGYGIPKE